MSMHQTRGTSTGALASGRIVGIQRDVRLTSLRSDFSLMLCAGASVKANSRRSRSPPALPVAPCAAGRHRRLDFVRGIWEARRHDLVTTACHHDHVFEIEAVAING